MLAGSGDAQRWAAGSWSPSGCAGLLSSFSAVDVLRPDQVVLALFLSPSALGLYVVGLAFTNLPYFIAKSVGLITFPWVASRREKADARRTMWSLLWLTTGDRRRHRGRDVRDRSLARSLLLRRPVRRRGHGHLHRPAGHGVPERAPGALGGTEGARLSARGHGRASSFRWPGSRWRSPCSSRSGGSTAPPSR